MDILGIFNRTACYVSLNCTTDQNLNFRSALS
jgi:hypothetical protein